MNDKIIKIINPKDGYINIPLELTFDFEGREDAINAYEAEIVKDIVNSPQDYEITKFAHSTYTVGLGPFINNAKTSINYQFYFYDFLNDVTASTVSNWAIDYQNASFTDNEIYYFANSFKGSFFKLDFYDTNNSENQRLLLSVILPTQQGLKEPGLIGPPNNLISVDVKKPNFVNGLTEVSINDTDEHGKDVLHSRPRSAPVSSGGSLSGSDDEGGGPGSGSGTSSRNKITSDNLNSLIHIHAINDSLTANNSGLVLPLNMHSLDDGNMQSSQHSHNSRRSHNSSQHTPSVAGDHLRMPPIINASLELGAPSLLNTFNNSRHLNNSRNQTPRNVVETDNVIITLHSNNDDDGIM